MSSVRGRDEKDKVKDMRDRARFDVDRARNTSVNKFRPDNQISRKPPVSNPSTLKVADFSGANVKRGSDVNDIVKNARNRSQAIKANSFFMNTPSIVDTKIIKASVGGAF